MHNPFQYILSSGPRSLTVSLLLRLGLGLAILMTGLMGVFTNTMETMGDRAQDELLRRQASDLLPFIRMGRKGDVVLLPSEEIKEVYRARYKGFMYVLHDGHGKILGRSHAMADDLLAKGLIPVNESTYLTTSVQDGNLQALYILVRPLSTPQGLRYITVGQYRAIDDDLLKVASADVRAQLLLWLGGALFLSLMLLAVMVRGALLPVRELSANVRALTPKNPDQRLLPSRVPAEVEPVVEAINGLMSQLGRALTAQKQLTADTAHQLKTPLAIMRARLELLDKLPGRDDLLNDITRMTRLVNQMLQFAELLQADPVLKDMDLRSLAKEVVGRLAPLAHKKKITLGYDGPNKPVPVAVDVLLAAEAVQNIVENALKHTPAGKTVTVDVKSNGVIEVIDQGPGIADGEKNMIFSRFWQGEGRTEGSGLGLAIVAEIMRQHGGKVSVRDGEAGSKKQGSVFALDFRPSA